MAPRASCLRLFSFAFWIASFRARTSWGNSRANSSSSRARSTSNCHRVTADLWGRMGRPPWGAIAEPEASARGPALTLRARTGRSEVRDDLAARRGDERLPHHRVDRHLDAAGAAVAHGDTHPVFQAAEGGPAAEAGATDVGAGGVRGAAAVARGLAGAGGQR